MHIDGSLAGTPTLGIPRPDVVAAYGNTAYLDSGFELLYTASSLSLGAHVVTVVAIDSTGLSTTLGPVNFTVATTSGPGALFGSIGLAGDSMTHSTTVGQSDSLDVKGWVADPQDAAPLTNVKVYIDGTVTGTPRLGIPRPDIVAAYGNTAFLDSGFELLYPASSFSLGAHYAIVIAVDSEGFSDILGPQIFSVQ